MLTPDQIAHLHTFGFLVLRRLFTPDEVALIEREAEEIMAAARQGHPFDPTTTQAVQPFFERRPFMAGLAADDRIYSLGEDVLGPDFLLDGTEGNFHVGDTPWHGGSGRQTRILPEIKIAFYPQPLAKDSGCLRVIPGTHRTSDPDPFQILRQRHDDPDGRPFGLHPSEVPCVLIETEPGDVVVFFEDTLHAAFGGAPGRHQHAINFVTNPKTDEQLSLLHELYEQHRFGFHPAESYIHSKEPRLRRIVGRLVELGFKSSKV